MKKQIFLSGLLVGLSAVLWGCGSGEEADGGGDDNTLVVFNYGDYIDMDVIDMFEEETGITVKYEQYVTPEDMYTKYQSGAIAYDLICTSDYMVEKMKEAGELQTIDTDNMSYYENLDPKYLDFCKSFDEDNSYSVPYFFGTVGICYNTALVEDEIESWESLWDENYKNLIVTENSMRDAFIAPLKLNGASINTTDEQELLDAQQQLFEQKDVLMAYMVDESRDAMIAGDAAMAMIYSGDACVAMEANEDLDYVVPLEGSNIWFDCWMIPKTAKHKEAAEAFIDFCCREDIAMMNFEYIYYGTPNLAVYEELDDETREDATVFPPEEVLANCEVYAYLGEDMERYYTQLWKELKSY